MTNTTLNVPRELLERAVRIPTKASVEENHAAIVDRGRAQSELRALLSAPSPAGVDGPEVVALWYADDDLGRAVDYVKIADGEGLCLISDAQATIDGLRGEVAQLQSMLATVSKAGIRVRTDRDQQAQRIGELEGLLRSCLPALSDGGCAALANRIDAALSAGKEGE